VCAAMPWRRTCLSALLSLPSTSIRAMRSCTIRSSSCAARAAAGPAISPAVALAKPARVVARLAHGHGTLRAAGHARP
jgi:hypothetical protein